MAKSDNDKQLTINFEDGVSPLLVWPDQNEFPLNLKERDYQVQKILAEDIRSTKNILILTGFTSLSYLIDTLGNKNYANLLHAGVVLGFEPNIKGRNRYHVWPLEKEIKEYWLKRGLSILSGGSVMNLIEKINQGKVEFKYLERLHAKIYVTDRAVILGSSNFSKNGLTLQTEANIRFTLTERSTRFNDIKQIAENYYLKAAPYHKMVDLLERLIRVVGWQDALARAIAEVLEGQWIEQYDALVSKLRATNLWPTQKRGLAQALTILQENSNVLIADPTGAGKTKMCSSIILALTSWLYETGRQSKDNSLIICPPLVVNKWQNEFRSLSKISNNQTSSGILSSPRAKKYKKSLEELRIANILAIDEAHNFLNLTSNRSTAIRKNNADFKLLITATPVNKKIDDLLKMVELLDVDNLSDDSFKVFKELKAKPNLRTQPNIQTLRNFVSQFTLRRTKKDLNEQIDLEPELYKNAKGGLCRFPKQVSKTYRTQETNRDIEIVVQINELCKNLYGVTYLKSINNPKYDLDDHHKEGYLKNRVNAAKKLSIYMIRSRLRSSKMALLEHIIGINKTREYEDFPCSKSSSNKIKLQEIQNLIDKGRTPRVSRVFDKSMLPDWLTDLKKYEAACLSDYEVYLKIAELTKELSNSRELGKADLLVNQLKQHQKVIAFDSTLVTLFYLKHLLKIKYPKQNVLVASGSNKKESEKVMNKFRLTSDNNDPIIALCSDKMSEGVDLQKASAVTLLDMPSVIRIVEQRFGRVDRMDTEHAEIELYWPEDDDVYSLKGDRRLLQLNELIDDMWGSNFEVPIELKHKHFKKVDSVHSLISEYSAFISTDASWDGIQDSFRPIVELKEGPNALITPQMYEPFRDVANSVKTKVSFVKSASKWCFFALRGDKTRSPRWIFIESDKEDQIFSDFPQICEKLRSNITKKSLEHKWDDSYLREFLDILQKKEIELLPPKKRRVLEVARHILERKLKDKDLPNKLKHIMNKLKDVLEPGTKDVDFETFAVLWIEFLQPYLDDRRERNRNPRNVFNLNSLKTPAEIRRIEFNVEQLEELYDRIPIYERIDHKIAACIVGVPG